MKKLVLSTLAALLLTVLQLLNIILTDVRYRRVIVMVIAPATIVLVMTTTILWFPHRIRRGNGE